MSEEVINEETHCPFCDVKYQEEFYSGSYETYLATCKCATASRYWDLKQELRKLDEFADLKRKLRAIPVAIKNLTENISYAEKPLLKHKKEVTERAKMLGIKISTVKMAEGGS